MRKVDLYFNYKYTFRFLIINGILAIKECSEVTRLDKTVIFFKIKDLADLSDASVYNYSYFFRFFFGVKPFFTQCLDVSTYKKTAYTFSVQAILRKGDMYSALFYLLNDVLPFVNKRDISLHSNFFDNIYLVYFVLINLDVFSSKKANLGLLNLRGPLELKFYFKGCDYFSCKYLMYFLKM